VRAPRSVAVCPSTPPNFGSKQLLKPAQTGVEIRIFQFFSGLLQ
jgi:hypothetical protein